MSAFDLKVKESESAAPQSFHHSEEAWFADRSRESKRLLRTSPTTPPPPIGDTECDRWFR